MMRALRYGLMATVLLAVPALAQQQQGGTNPPTAAAPGQSAGQAPARAPAQPDVNNVSPEALAAAQEMMRAINATAVAEQTMAQVSQQITAALAQNSGKPVGEVSAIVEDVLMPEFRRRIPEMMDFTARLWASQMSPAELRELSAFYRTPLGQRLNEVAPTVATQSALFGMRWGQDVGRSALAKHREELRARGLKI
ncbi:hypothetical protein HMPREF9946_04523 [Acetobacteraceae bacterium AT-5844]|nr:hypothetical protein HMPREF9946_04523 [Acetobacteraceae bacterium AT-5844]